jgi:hypothetical protein
LATTMERRAEYWVCTCGQGYKTFFFVIVEDA